MSVTWCEHFLFLLLDEMKLINLVADIMVKVEILQDFLFSDPIDNYIFNVSKCFVRRTYDIENELLNFFRHYYSLASYIIVILQ